MYHTYRADLAKVRALVLQQARAAGLAEGRANDLVLAVSEVAANTLRHTQSDGTLTIWRQAGEIICEIRDEGTISDPRPASVGPGPTPPADTASGSSTRSATWSSCARTSPGPSFACTWRSNFPTGGRPLPRSAAEFELVPLRNPVVAFMW